MFPEKTPFEIVDQSSKDGRRIQIDALDRDDNTFVLATFEDRRVAGEKALIYPGKIESYTWELDTYPFGEFGYIPWNYEPNRHPEVTPHTVATREEINRLLSKITHETFRMLNFTYNHISFYTTKSPQYYPYDVDSSLYSVSKYPETRIYKFNEEYIFIPLKEAIEREPELLQKAREYIDARKLLDWEGTTGIGIHKYKADIAPRDHGDDIREVVNVAISIFQKHPIKVIGDIQTIEYIPFTFHPGKPKFTDKVKFKSDELSMWIARTIEAYNASKPFEGGAYGQGRKG